MTKARVRVAATAIANSSSGGEEPLTTSFFTSIGCARRSISGPATSRLSRAWPAKLFTSRSELRSGPGGSAGSSAPRMRAVARRPRIWTAIPATRNWPPSISRSRYLPPSLAIRRAIVRLAWAIRVAIRSSTSRALTGSSWFSSTSTLGVPGVSVESELSWSTRSSGRISAASTSPDSTSATASSRLSTRTHWTREQMRSLTPTAGSWRSPPTLIRVSAGTSLRKAIRGFSGEREIAKPTSTAISTG